MMYLSPESVRKIFEKYKAPESIVIAVVGDIEPAATLKLIENYFGVIPPAPEKSGRNSCGAAANGGKKGIRSL